MTTQDHRGDFTQDAAGDPRDGTPAGAMPTPQQPYDTAPEVQPSSEHDAMHPTQDPRQSAEFGSPAEFSQAESAAPISTPGSHASVDDSTHVDDAGHIGDSGHLLSLIHI